jgi:hypothetical protein
LDKAKKSKYLLNGAIKKEQKRTKISKKSKYLLNGAIKKEQNPKKKVKKSKYFFSLAHMFIIPFFEDDKREHILDQ